MRLLEKWKCVDDSCGRSFLVDMESAERAKLTCPYCRAEAESVAHQNPAADIETQLEGCLYPS